MSHLALSLNQSKHVVGWWYKLHTVLSICKYFSIKLVEITMFSPNKPLTSECLRGGTFFGLGTHLEHFFRGRLFFSHPLNTWLIFSHPLNFVSFFSHPLIFMQCFTPLIFMQCFKPLILQFFPIFSHFLKWLWLQDEDTKGISTIFMRQNVYRWWSIANHHGFWARYS